MPYPVFPHDAPVYAEGVLPMVVRGFNLGCGVHLELVMRSAPQIWVNRFPLGLPGRILVVTSGRKPWGCGWVVEVVGHQRVFINSELSGDMDPEIVVGFRHTSLREEIVTYGDPVAFTLIPEHSLA